MTHLEQFVSRTLHNTVDVLRRHLIGKLGEAQVNDDDYVRERCRHGVRMKDQ